MWVTLLDRMLKHMMRRGRLELTLADGRVLEYGSGPPTMRVQLHDADLPRRIALNPDLAVGEAYIRFALDNPDRYRLMHDALQCDPGAFPDLARAQARSRRTLTDYIQDLVAEGELQGDPEVLGHIFWATTHGLLSLYLAGRLGSRADFDTLYRSAMRLLARGASPEENPQPARQRRRA